MTMVVSRKQRIFFRYEGERGAFLVLHHGLLGSHDDWYAAGYVEELAKEFRVVVPDARGHGRSDKAAERDQYSQLQMAEDIVEIMNELGIRNSHFVGYGLGALVGFELLRRFPDRVRISILGGESALVSPTVQDVYRAEAESLKAMSLAEYLKALRDQGRVVRTAEAVDEELERPATLALLEAISGWEPAPSERIQVTSPLTLFAGTDDPAAARVEAARSGISRSRYVPFQGFSHTRLFQERGALMEEVLRLLKSGRRDEGTDTRPREGGAAGSDSNRPAAQGPDRRRVPPGRRDGPRQGGGRWSERRGGGRPDAPAQPPVSAEAPSPIPGAVLDGQAATASGMETSSAGVGHRPPADAVFPDTTDSGGSAVRGHPTEGTSQPQERSDDAEAGHESGPRDGTRGSSLAEAEAAAWESAAQETAAPESAPQEPALPGLPPEESSSHPEAEPTLKPSPEAPKE